MKKLFWLLVPLLAFAQPPSPPPPLSALLRTLPRDHVYEEVITNSEPILFRVTVTSNIVRQTIWRSGETLRTNFSTLETNIVSCVTNTSGVTP